MLKLSDMREVDKLCLLGILCCILIDSLSENWSAVLGWTACACWMMDGVVKDNKIKNTVKSINDLKQIIQAMKK